MAVAIIQRADKSKIGFLSALDPVLDAYLKPLSLLVNLSHRTTGQEIVLDLLFAIRPDETEYTAIVRVVKEQVKGWAYTGECKVIEE
ncbi:MAG: hypothetical protein ACRCZS_12810 [Chroococcidiopsis sp.]